MSQWQCATVLQIVSKYAAYQRSHVQKFRIPHLPFACGRSACGLCDVCLCMFATVKHISGITAAVCVGNLHKNTRHFSVIKSAVLPNSMKYEYVIIFNR